MKNIFLFIAILFANTICYGQNQVYDTHPGASIYIYDPQSGQEVLAESNEAILFKDAVMELVINTPEAKIISGTSPGRKSYLITQAAPAQGNAYQIELNSKIFGQSNTLYTFSYNVDQNTLYYFDTNSQTWEVVSIRPNNIMNLNNANALGKFNDPQNWNTATDDGTGDAPVQANTPPPPLQEYEQPPCPVDGYLWQPGYWAYNGYNGGYYWVAGTWVAPPTPGYLWTPPYWGYEGGIYAFHPGYWGVSIGFYGGINYGYGYAGHGYYGGVWEGGHFRYNTAVVRVNTTVIHNTYVDRTVIVNNTVVNNKRVSFNGPGGTEAKPTPQETKAANQPRIRDSSQDPKALKPANKSAAAGGQRTMPNSNAAKTPAANTQRTPGFPNSQKTNGNVPKAPGNAPGVPKVPSNVPGANRTNTPGGQRQPAQEQYGNQKGNKPPVKTDKNPPSSNDKKKP